MREGHEGTHFLMRHPHILHKILGFFEPDIKATRAIARIAKHPVQPPFRQTLPYKFRNILRPFCDFFGHGARGKEWPRLLRICKGAFMIS